MQYSARSAALTALERCRRDGAWSGASIDNAIKKYALDRRDAALASNICLGVLQNSRLCDFYIDYFCTGKKLEPKVRDILRIGVYQLLFLDKIPARAAVNETVVLCGEAGLSRATGLVNAVLRRVSGSLDALPEIPGKGSAEYLAVKYSYPDWLVGKLIAERGYETCEAFLRASNQAPELAVQINTLAVSTADYLRALDRAEIEYSVPAFPADCVTLKGGSVPELPGYEEGLFYVQDRAARASVEAAELLPGMRVLDACAAPGGKSFAAAIRMQNSGSITSCDIHPKKLELIKAGAGRLGIGIISVKTQDGRMADGAMLSAFDAVIADVPCSGIGVIRKKPEIRLKKEEEIKGLPSIQLAILNNLSSYVRPGGTLLYSTCTVMKEENEGVIEAFLAEHKEYGTQDFLVGNKASENGCMTFWPQKDGTDGFFACKLKRALEKE